VGRVAGDEEAPRAVAVGEQHTRPPRVEREDLGVELRPDEVADDGDGIDVLDGGVDALRDAPPGALEVEASDEAGLGRVEDPVVHGGPVGNARRQPRSANDDVQVRPGVVTVLVTGTDAVAHDGPGVLRPPALDRLASDLAGLRRPCEAVMDPEDLAAGGYPILVLTSGRTPAFEVIAEAIAERAGATHTVVSGTGHAVRDDREPVNGLLEELWSRAGVVVTGDSWRLACVGTPLGISGAAGEPDCRRALDEGPRRRSDARDRLDAPVTDGRSLAHVRRAGHRRRLRPRTEGGRRLAGLPAG
jgi:hypothetical protein